jgi:hypothetical protein
LRIPESFLGKDPTITNQLKDVYGEVFAQFVEEKCSRTLELYIWAKNVLNKMCNEEWFKKGKVLMFELAPSASFEDTLFSFMMHRKIDSMDLLKCSPVMALNEYFPSKVSEELLKDWNGPNSVASWLADIGKSPALVKPVVKIPANYVSSNFDSDYLTLNNIHITGDKESFRPLLQEMEKALPDQFKRLKKEYFSRINPDSSEFENDATSPDLVQLLRDLFSQASWESEDIFFDILRQNKEDGFNELSHARGGYSMLYHDAFWLMRDKFQIRFDQEMTPWVPVVYNRKLFKLICKPDSFCRIHETGWVGGIVEEKVVESNFTANLNKSIFLCFLIWKQFQLYAKNLDMGTLQLPVIVLHSRKLELYGFVGSKIDTAADGDPTYEFNYTRLIDLDLSVLTNYSKARDIMYNYFLFYKNLLTKCAEDSEALKDYGVIKLPSLSGSSDAKSRAESGDLNQQPGNTNVGQKMRPPMFPSGKGKQKAAQDSAEPETDTYEFLCRWYSLTFCGGLPLASCGLPLLEEAQVRDHGVFLAEDDNYKKVVVKFARFGDESAGFLQNEIDVLRKLSEAGYSSGAKYLDSEIIESHELVVLITSYCGTPVGYLKHIDLQKWLDLSEGLYNAVADIHQHGVIHCDLSPNNVCLLNNEIKIIDFGLSVYCDSDGKSLTRIRTRGTEGFIAPEFSDDKKKLVTTAVDVYSVGMMLKRLWENVDKECFVENNKKQVISELLDDLTRERVGERVTLEKALQKFDMITSKKRARSVMNRATSADSKNDDNVLPVEVSSF